MGSSEKIPAYIRTNAATWLANNIQACCERYYSWSYKECVVDSGGTLPAQDGAGQWYVDWLLEKCVMDCEKTSDPQCGGLAKSWDGLYASASACCERIGYVERSECTL